MSRPERSVDELCEQLRALGLGEGATLVVHTSFRQVAPVSGGPEGLILALRRVLGESGTLVMPTMTAGDGPFNPGTTPTLDMGIVAETFWRQTGVRRSTHPGASFAAIGPHAERICAPQPLSPPHGMDSPVGRVHELDGQVLLLGVGHGEHPRVHLAESVAAVPYSVEHPCVVEVDGEHRTLLIAETDHCCRGFEQVDDWLEARGAQALGVVGHATARLCSSRRLVSIVVEQLAGHPTRFLCDEQADCAECRAAWASIQG